MSDAEELNPARIPPGQELLFPLTARQLSIEIGLNWWAALSLHREDWLSFDPETTEALTENQEHELRFLGALVTGGCTPPMLASLLDGLPRPYCYEGRKIYYDWSETRWRLLPENNPDPESVFEDWLESLSTEQEHTKLEEIRDRVDAALRRALRQ